MELLTAGWCSWLSRVLNTDKVLGSNPSLVTHIFALENLLQLELQLYQLLCVFLYMQYFIILHHLIRLR